MSKPKTVHTLESLLARTEEIGECLVWTGYSVGGKVPQVLHNGKMTAVRKVVLELQGKPTDADYFGTSCGTTNCVCEAHIAARSGGMHMVAMGKQATQGTNSTRRKKSMTVARRKRPDTKLDLQKAREIRESDEPNLLLAQKYGVCKSLISRIKRGTYWRDQANPFAGLVA